MYPVIRPFWDMSIAENLEAFTNGANVHQLPNIFTEQFYNGLSGLVALELRFL